MKLHFPIMNIIITVIIITIIIIIITIIPIMRMIFYFLLIIVFRGRFPYLKLISYILLSYSVFAISMLTMRDWNFHATNTVMFLRFLL